MDNKKITTDREEIKKWVEKFGGKPQFINDPHGMADIPGIRIDFPGPSDDKLLSKAKVKNVSWDDFFKEFEAFALAFEYIPNPANKNTVTLSEAYRFVKRDAQNTDLEETKLIDEFVEELTSDR